MTPAHRTLALILRATLFVSIAALPPAAIVRTAFAADWSNQGGHAARNALTAESGPETAALAWSGGRSSLIAWHPVTEGNRVFMVRQPKWPTQQPDDAYVVAKDLTTGSELWARVLPYNPGDWIPWIAGARDGHVYASRSGNGASVSAKLFALDAATGATVWESEALQDAGAYDAVVFADDGDLLVGSFQDIWRIDAGTGATVWHAARVGSVSGSCGGARSGNGYYVLDAVPGGHALRKFDSETGAPLYASPTMPGFLSQTMPFVAPDGTVLINRAENSASNDFLYAWTDTGSGFSLKWQTAGFSGANAQLACGPDGSVYAIVAGSRLARLDGATGAIENWIPAPAGLSMARMATDAAGRLYFSNGATGGGHLYVYTADLAPLWDTVVNGINIGGPSIGASGTLVVCSTGTDVRAYRGTDPAGTPEAIPLAALHCVPNPSWEQTSIAFTLDREGPVRLALYDVRGRLVRTLLAERRAAGAHRVDWQGRDATGTRVPSGVYLYRLETEEGASSGRLVRAR